MDLIDIGAVSQPPALDLDVMRNSREGVGRCPAPADV
jgi:hypothetical protein